MMNMVPNRDVFNSMNILTNDIYDFLAPLQILNGNSLADYNLNNETFIKDNLIDKTSERDIHDAIAASAQ
jgi:hypothetical protein